MNWRKISWFLYARKELTLTFFEKIRLISKLPAEQRRWLFDCVIGSILANIAIRLLPMQRISGRMGHYLGNRQLCTLASEDQCIKAHQIGQLMRSVSKHVPWQCDCLSQALCVQWLLGREHIPSVFYLGARLEAETVTQSTSKNLKAHAWITSGPHTVIGAPTHLQYRAVATFIQPSLS